MVITPLCSNKEDHYNTPDCKLSFVLKFFSWLALIQIGTFFFTATGFSTPAFTASPSTGPAPLVVQFFNQTTGSITSRLWDFGDGETSTELNPVHTFEQPGNYTVSLTNYVSTFTYSISHVITVTHTPEPPDLSSPQDGVTHISRTPTLETGDFSVPDGNDRHLGTEWQVSKNPDFSTLILSSGSPVHLTSLVVPTLVLEENTTYYWRARFYSTSYTPSDWSEVFSFTTLTTQDDQNANGIPDALENQSADLDNDGQADIGQSHIKTLNTVVGNGQAGLSIKESSTVVSNPEITALDPETISRVSLPSSMPLGLFGIRLNVTRPGDTADVTFYFSQAAPLGAGWYKYDTIDGWVDASDSAIFSPDRKSVTVSLTDGGIGDADGVANGIIVDPCGFGIASWIKGLISDVSTGDPILTANVCVRDMNLAFNSFLQGNYLGMLLPGTYDLDVSAYGYDPESVSGLMVSEAETVTRDIVLLKKAKIKGLTISGTQEVYNPVRFTVSAESDADKLYYRFSVRSQYGTSGYDSAEWISMSDTEWSSRNYIDYRFTANGKYIVVVWVTSDPDSADFNQIAILGTSVEIGEHCATEFKGFTLSGTQAKNSPVTISIDAQNSCSSDLYYRYSVHPYYGTDDYDGTQWTGMTSTEWTIQDAISYTFTEQGKYIVVIWAVRNSGNIPEGVPIIGWSVDIE